MEIYLKSVGLCMWFGKFITVANFFWPFSFFSESPTDIKNRDLYEEIRTTKLRGENMISWVKFKDLSDEAFYTDKELRKAFDKVSPTVKDISTFESEKRLIKVSQLKTLFEILEADFTEDDVNSILERGLIKKACDKTDVTISYQEYKKLF